MQLDLQTLCMWQVKTKVCGGSWENGDIAGREPSGAANADLGDVRDLLRELVEGQKMMAAEVRVLGENVEDRLGDITEAVMWGQDPVQDAEDYAELVFEGPVHQTAKNRQPDRTEP